MLLKKSALILAASLLAMGSAHAVTAFTNNATLGVTVNVTAAAATTTCSFSNTAPTVTASYTSGASAAQVTQYGSINISCGGTAATPFIVSANGGSNATVASRRAKFGASDYIDYKLQTGPMVVADWGDGTTFGTGSAGTTVGGATNTAFSSFNLIVPAAQTAPTGAYTDTVTLTATF